MHALSEAEVLSDGQHLLAVEDITLARPMCAHSHGFAQVSLVRGGRADQHTEEGVNHLDTNTIVVLSPGSWHSYDPAPTIDLTNLYLSRDLLAAARIPHLPIDLPPSLREALDPTQAHGTVATYTITAQQRAAIAAVLREIGDGPKSSILAQLAHFYRLLDTIAPVPRSLDTQPPQHPRPGTSPLRRSRHACDCAAARPPRSPVDAGRAGQRSPTVVLAARPYLPGRHRHAAHGIPTTHQSRTDGVPAAHH